LNKKYKILVTGCGGDIGQSIGKILKSYPLFDLVVGCDMSDQHAGKFIFDKCFTIPPRSSNQYERSLKNIIQELRIDVILPIAEPELRFNSENDICDNFLGIPLISANLPALKIGFDKFLTAKFLRDEKLPFPATEIVSDVKEPALPLIIKSRKGSGSKSLYLITDRKDFDFYSKKFPDFIAQEFIDNGDEEYTCGLFRSNKGEIRSIIFRRKLMGGYSGFGTVVQNRNIDHLLINVAARMDLRGSINVQLRLTKDNTPIVFEINPRFSSTVLFRHLLGFEDVIWSIQDQLGLNISMYRPPQVGRNFYKGFSEYID
jgi:carbamoyl-phosphate synthase large subunit